MTLRDAFAQALGTYRALIASRAISKPQPHELDPVIAGQALWASLRGFPKAATSPYVIDKMRKVAGPILAMCAAVCLLGWAILLPASIIAHLVGAVLPGVDARGLTGAARAGLHSAVSVLAVIAMVVMRKVLHKPIFKCFIHTLRDVDPQLAARLESAPPLPAPIKPKGAPVKQGSSEPPKSHRPLGEMAFAGIWKSRLGRALLLAVLTHFWRQVPVARHLAAPTMLFFSAERLLGTERALVAAAAAALPGLGAHVVAALDLWRTSSAVGQELLSDYTSRLVPADGRQAFLRDNEVPIFAFLAPQLLLFRLPVVGPLMFLPAAAAAAYLAAFLDHLPSNRGFTAGSDKLS